MTVLRCPEAECPHTLVVSGRDPDSTVSELIRHLREEHAHTLATAVAALATVFEEGR